MYKFYPQRIKLTVFFISRGFQNSNSHLPVDKGIYICMNENVCVCVWIYICEYNDKNVNVDMRNTPNVRVWNM